MVMHLIKVTFSFCVEYMYCMLTTVGSNLQFIVVFEQCLCFILLLINNVTAESKPIEVIFNTT